jgi:diacylglycerol kinase family enzyme
MKVAVVAHAGKSLGGGLPELRRVLEAEGVAEPFWCEVPKSRKAPAQVRRAVAEGARLIFVWGGDGMVQRSVAVLAGSDVTLAIVPAGTANLFATSLGIPQHVGRAVAIGLRGADRKLDVGRFNGERFSVMAGAGFDAAMIRDAGTGGLKERLGRVAYVWTGSKNLRSKPFRARIDVDGVRWYKGKASCILFGNTGELFGGVSAFEEARPDDGQLELGVVDAQVMGDLEDRPRRDRTGDLEVRRERHRSPPDGTGRRAADPVADAGGAECRSKGACRSAARMRWLSRSALVNGPTPPGTGLIAEATSTAHAKSTSPTR